MSAFKRYVLTKVTLHLHTEPFQIGSQSLLVMVSIFSKNTTKSPSSSNQHHDEDIYVMDPSNPVGDACRNDGTLKDASEMDWPNSPTEYNRALIEEQFFSLSGRTDDPRRGQLKKTKFGGLQKIRAGYLDGRLSVEDDIMGKYFGDFTFD